MIDVFMLNLVKILNKKELKCLFSMYQYNIHQLIFELNENEELICKIIPIDEVEEITLTFNNIEITELNTNIIKEIYLIVLSYLETRCHNNKLKALDNILAQLDIPDVE